MTGRNGPNPVHLADTGRTEDSPAGWSRLTLEAPEYTCSVVCEANDLDDLVMLLVIPLLRAAGYTQKAIDDWIPDTEDPHADRAVALREILDTAQGALTVDADCGDPERRMTEALGRVAEIAGRALG